MIEEVVYYARFGDQIKIGTTKNFAQRMGTQRPDELLAIEPGGRDLEGRRHNQFEYCRLRAEMFDMHPRLLKHVERLARRRPVPDRCWSTRTELGWQPPKRATPTEAMRLRKTRGEQRVIAERWRQRELEESK